MIVSLNILRGVAALLVLIFHIHMEMPPLRPFLFWASSYYLFVDMFFILSGLIMVLVYSPEGSPLSAVQYRAFMWRRFARIYPLHLLTTGFILAMASAILVLRSTGAVDVPMPDIFDGNSVKAVVSNLFLVQSWGLHGDFTMNTVSWSISVEWAMYLLFPLLLLAYARLPAAVILVVTTGLYLIIYYSLTPGTLDANLRFGLVRALAGFASGMALYKLLKDANWSIRTASLTFALAIGAIAVLSVAFPGHWSIIFAFWALIASSFRLESKLNLKPTWVRVGAWLGDVSYSLYLWHLIIILLAKQVFDLVFKTNAEELSFIPALLFTGLLVIVILIVSHVSFHWIEKPARNKLRHRPSQDISLTKV